MIQADAVRMREDSSDSSLSEYNYGKNITNSTIKQETKRFQPILSKTKDKKINRLRNNSTINSKGEYESENESKSMNSTTTSSTMQFISQTRNYDN